ncbi:hypothetical protein TNCV_814321 [Trichonephila clavipes]|nr:hypothetical protein TNCV_814321 [Trichonephila clavipes]
MPIIFPLIEERIVFEEEAGIIHGAEIVHEAGTVQEAGIVQEENSFNLPETCVCLHLQQEENQHQIRRKEREQGKI